MSRAPESQSSEVHVPLPKLSPPPRVSTSPSGPPRNQMSSPHAPRERIAGGRAAPSRTAGSRVLAGRPDPNGAVDGRALRRRTAHVRVAAGRTADDRFADAQVVQVPGTLTAEAGCRRRVAADRVVGRLIADDRARRSRVAGGWTAAGRLVGNVLAGGRVGGRSAVEGRAATGRDVGDRSAEDRARESGVATVFGCLALIALLAVTAMFVQVGAVVVARHRAQSVADLGALAVAGALTSGVAAGCAEGEALVRSAGMRIRACAVAEWDATVIVEGDVPIGLLSARTVRAVARAGPVEDEH